MSSLALTMIVRDEEARLPDFLAHHAGLADELVVVDTGSQDRTPAILAAAGARVIHHRWADDFSAARNAGLAAVAADWVLFLDADERLSRQDFPKLRSILALARPQAFLQETWNYCPEGGHLEWQPLPARYPTEEAGQEGLFVARRVGVFPRQAQLRFSGRVHESVLPAVQTAGLPVTALDLPVHHYGHLGEAAAAAARRTRYLHWAEQKLRDDPDDPAAGLELASLRLESGDLAGARQLLERVARGPRGLRPVVRALVLLGRLQREAGDGPAARELLADACGQDPDFVFAWVEAIRVESEAGAWLAAEDLLTAAERRFGAGHPQLLGETVRVRIKRGQLTEALLAAEDLVRIRPQWRQMSDLAARLRHMTGAGGKPPPE